MDAIIDNTYLHSVGRCLDGKARNKEDCRNFLRFLGEYISSRKLYYTANKSGPVYPFTKETIKYLYYITGDQNILEFIDQDTIDYNDLCSSVIEQLRIDLEIGDIIDVQRLREPDFKKNSDHPDLKIHDVLTGSKKSLLKNDIDLTKGAPNTAAYIVTHKRILPQLIAYAKDHENWNINDTLGICGLVRMYLYQYLAQSQNRAYLPSFGFHNRRRFQRTDKQFINDPNILFLFEQYDSITKNKDEVGTVISSIIAAANGDPRRMIEIATEMRKNLVPLRDNFHPNKSSWPTGFFAKGDSWLQVANIDLIRRYAQVLSIITGQKSGNDDCTTLTQLSTEVLAGPKISSIEKAVNWIRTKNNKNLLIPIASIINRTKQDDKASLKDRFYRSCGIDPKNHRHVILLYGFPCAGKTTIANHILRDSIYIYRSINQIWNEMNPNPNYSTKSSEIVFKRYLEEIKKDLSTNHNIILEGVFATGERIEQVADICISEGYTFHPFLLRASISTLLKRLTKRNKEATSKSGKVPEAALHNFNKSFNSRQFAEAEFYTDSLSAEIITENIVSRVS